MTKSPAVKFVAPLRQHHISTLETILIHLHPELDKDTILIHLHPELDTNTILIHLYPELDKVHDPNPLTSRTQHRTRT
jgi:hypothetical protein